MKRHNFLFVFIIILMTVPLAGASGDVASNFSGSSTMAYATATWTELPGANLTLYNVGTGNTTVRMTFDSRVNYSGSVLYARVKRNGTVLAQFNVTSLNAWQVNSLEATTAETAGSPMYGVDIYSTAGRQGQIARWNMTVIHLNDGTYGTGGSGNVSSITCSPAGVIDCTGTDAVTITLTQWITNATAVINRSQVTGQEGIDTAMNTTAAALQVNDTYFNGTVFPNSTNFRNDTISTKEPAISTSTASKFYAWDKTWRDILISYIIGLSSMLDAMNNSAGDNNTASIDRDNAVNSSKYNKSDLPNCNPTTQKGVPNGSGITCETDLTSSFSYNGISGAAYSYSPDGTITITTEGSNINFTAPALSLSNATINPYNYSLANASGTLPESQVDMNYPSHAAIHTLNDSTNHTGKLNWLRIENFTINLTGTANKTGQLPDEFIASAATWNTAIRFISCITPITCDTVGTTTTINSLLTNNSVQLPSLSQVTGLWSILNNTNTSKADAIYSNQTFLNKTALNATVQITIPQVTGLLGTFDLMNVSSGNNDTWSRGRDTIQNISITNMNATFNGTNRVVTPLSFSFNTTTIGNISTITALPAKFNGTVTELNVTKLKGTGYANISFWKSGVYVTNVNITNVQYQAATTGLNIAFVADNTLLWQLDTATPNLRLTITTVTRRS